MSAVDSHYYVLYQRLRREIHQKNIIRHREILNMVQEKFNSGRGTNQDGTLMQSRLAIVETSAARVNMDLEEAISHYEEIYSFAPGDIKRPDVSMELPITSIIRNCTVMLNRYCRNFSTGIKSAFNRSTMHVI